MISKASFYLLFMVQTTPYAEHEQILNIHLFFVTEKDFLNL